MDKINVIHFNRRPRPGFNYSIESIFEQLRHDLENRVSFSVKTSRFFNTGYVSKLYNILEAALRQKKDSISHITGETYFLNLLMQKKRVVVTIHDCRFMERKRGLTKKIIQWLYLTGPVHNSSFVTAVSEITKKDIVRYTHCNPEKIIVIPNPIQSIFIPVPKCFNKTKPVLLQIGAAENKNLSRLTDAIKSIPCTLVLVGDVATNDLHKLKENKIDYIIKKNLNNDELYKEYINCDIVTFVSTFEGFGMPIIEANSVERAVITSTISSMPEVAGDAACLVNPFDVTSIREGIKKIIHDDIYREQLIENGRANRLRFDATAIASQYYQLYLKIAGGAN